MSTSQSGSDAEELVDEAGFTFGASFTQDAMAAADHAHDLEALIVALAVFIV